jgi:hypothetical protein
MKLQAESFPSVGKFDNASSGVSRTFIRDRRAAASYRAAKTVIRDALRMTVRRHAAHQREG